MIGLILFLFTMLSAQATKEYLLITICLVCFGTMVLGFFLYVNTHIDMYRSIYIHMTVSLDVDTVVHFNFFIRVLSAKKFCPFPVKTLMFH